MNEKEFPEFDLEDILREFGDHPEQPPEEAEEAPAPEVIPEEIPEEIPEVVPEPEQIPEVPDLEIPAVDMTADTIRMEPLQDFPRAEPRDAAPIHEEMDQTRRFQPITEEEAAQWEPEYEPPIPSYTPPQKILRHPSAWRQELKKKLVNGPEKRYYALSEKGCGKLQVMIFLSILVVLLSAGATVLYTLGMVQENRMRLMVFGQLFAMMLSALIGSFQLIDGVADLFRGRFSLNTLLVFTLILCCVDGVLCLQQLRVPCCAAFSLEVTFSLLAAYHRRNMEMNQMDTLRKATQLHAVRPAEGELDGHRVLLQDEGQVEDFMDKYDLRSAPEITLSLYSLIALVASIGVGVTAFVLYDLSVAVQVAAITLLAAVPASGFICHTRPAAILEKKLRPMGTLLCGWPGVSAAKGKILFPLSHKSLFPAGAVKMNGVKFFGNRSTDEIIAYATALIEASGNGLTPLFVQVLDNRNCRHLSVENLRDYDGGVGGEVLDEPVLIGTLSFLRTMGVEIPEGLRVSQAVCIAIDGELCGLFAITYEKTADTVSSLSTLGAYRGLHPIITAGDFLLTPGFLRAKFGISPKRVLFADSQTRGYLADLKAAEDAAAVLVTTRDGLAPLAYGVTGARALWNACHLGTLLHIIGGALGIAIMLVLVLLGGVHLLTPANVFLYQLVWVVPSLLITEWTRMI